MAAKDIPAAAEWSTNIRTALRTANTVLLLLTPRSVNKPWILLETGAGWALGKKLMPVLVHVEPTELVDPLRSAQARVMETPDQQRALAKELAQLVNAPFALTSRPERPELDDSHT